MKIEISNTEKNLFIDAAYINLDYWIYEADAREYYNEIFGTLIILSKLDTSVNFKYYQEDFYKEIKQSEELLEKFNEIFPDFKEV
jgi:hypothetical protein